MPSATATSVAAQCIADGPALDVASVISPISLRSTWWEPDGVKSLGIGFNLRDIAATKLCLKPRCDCGIGRAANSCSATFLASQVCRFADRRSPDRKANSGISGMIRLKGHP